MNVLIDKFREYKVKRELIKKLIDYLYKLPDQTSLDIDMIQYTYNLRKYLMDEIIKTYTRVLNTPKLVKKEGLNIMKKIKNNIIDSIILFEMKKKKSMNQIKNKINTEVAPIFAGKKVDEFKILVENRISKMKTIPKAEQDVSPLTAQNNSYSVADKSAKTQSKMKTIPEAEQQDASALTAQNNSYSVADKSAKTQSNIRDRKYVDQTMNENIFTI